MPTELVAVRTPSTGDLVDAWDRLAGLGDALLPLDPHAPDDVVTPLLDRLRPHALAQPHPTKPGLRIRRLPNPRPVPDGTALVVPTSGSTGRPKGVVLHRSALEASTQASLDRLGIGRRDDGDATRWLGCLPLHHVAGLQVVLRARRCGSQPILHDRFDIEAIRRLTEQADSGFTHVSLVPTQLTRLLDAGVDLGGRTVLLGGAAAPDPLLERARQAGIRVVVSYGMTETCGGCVYDGEPLEGVDVRLEDDGRIALSGPMMLSGYHGDPEAAAQVLQDGWFLTSDRGRWVDGRLEVLGRLDDVIVTGGENVSAEAVATRLREHPDVMDAGVVGRPDAEWGEIVVAVVVPTDPTSPPDLAALRTHVRKTLPAAAAPRRLVLVDEMPTTGLGKTATALLRRLAD